jgi:hypothetical protein
MWQKSAPVLVFVGNLATATFAETLDFTISAPLAGVEYELPTTAESYIDVSTSKPRIDGIVNIQPIVSDLDGIIRRLGLTVMHGGFQSWEYHGTGGAVQANELWIKYHFRVDPHNSPPTNGSIELFIHPEISGGGVVFIVHHVQVNISNDLVNVVLEISNVDEVLEAEIASAVNEAISRNPVELPSLEIWGVKLLDFILAEVKLRSENGVGFLDLVAIPSSRVRVWQANP